MQYLCAGEEKRLMTIASTGFCGMFVNEATSDEDRLGETVAYAMQSANSAPKACGAHR